MNLWERAGDALVLAALTTAELLKRSGERIDRSLLGSQPTAPYMPLREREPRSISTDSEGGFTLGRLLDAAATAEPSSDQPRLMARAPSAARADTIALLVGMQVALSEESAEALDFEVVEVLQEVIIALLDAEDRLQHGS